MATWHQQQRPVKLWHDTKYTVVVDPPNRTTCCMLFDTYEQAQAYQAKTEHSYILQPALKTFDLYWAPEGGKIATVQATDERTAKKKAPAPYKEYQGEVYAVQINQGQGDKMKKELVYSYLNDKSVFAERQSNQTLLVAKHKLPDSDRLIITDKTGHRYARNSIGLEGFCVGFYIFNMI